MADERVALVRNPYFRVWSPAAQPDGYVDRIEWAWRVFENWEDELEAVDAGEADLAFDLVPVGAASTTSSSGSRHRSRPPVPGDYFLCSTPRHLPSMTSTCAGR